MTPKSESEQFLLRLPHELKRWIEQEATLNGATQTSEIIRAIRARMMAVERAAKRAAD
jgi:hypothetical protein